jgi:aconitate hydratase 2/2-methylisocitrate dehydratase
VVHQPPEVPQSLTITVFKVPGETNTDDLSPAPDATTRPDIPLHALAMLKNKRDDAPFTRKKTASAARSSRSST